MGLFKHLFQKQGKTYANVQTSVSTLQSQNGQIERPTKADLDYCLQNFFEDEEQFVTYTLAKAQNCIRYIQASYVHSKINIQLGIEKGSRTHLVEKRVATIQECADIFELFFNKKIVENLDEYTPVIY